VPVVYFRCSGAKSAISAAWPLRPGVEVRSWPPANFCAGYIDTYAPEFGDGYHRAIIYGRSKTKDAVDSRRSHPKRLEGEELAGLAENGGTKICMTSPRTC